MLSANLTPGFVNTQIYTYTSQPKMTSKHWKYGEHEDLVVSHLRALASLNPTVRLIPSEKVLYDPHNSQSKNITLISGGGGGHEPLHAGYVGENLLDAAVSGAIFASPSTRQIMAAIKKVSSKKEGAATLVIVKNYTGDILHFGLAVERAKAEGYSAELLVVADDVAVGREQNKMVGRRGLAGTAIVHKILGAATASRKDYTLSTIQALGKSVNENLVTLGASLDRTSVPGRASHHEEGDEESSLLNPNAAELGLGIHNEPGHKISPIPNIDTLLKDMFHKLLSTEDKDRHYVNFDDEDDYVLLINNIGGTSTLELYVIVEHVLAGIPLHKRPKRVLVSDFVTSLNAPGFSVTLLNLSNIERDSRFAKDEILEYIDMSTNAPGWKPKSYDSKSWDQKTVFEESPMEDHHAAASSSLQVDGNLVFNVALKRAMELLISKEPKITHYDTLVGDGDCGETLVAGADSILKALAENKAFQSTLNDPIATLSYITELVENSMGGTSGGLYSIFLTALVHFLQQSSSISIDSVASALHSALYEGLFKYTKARIGGRTLVDTLQPFVDSLAETKDLSKATEAARKGCNSTIDLQAKFGRASYVADEEFKNEEGGIPDPGAVGLLAIIEGFAEGLS